MSATRRTHVCFGHSARGTLSQTLRSVGRDEEVLNFWGEYVAGPLKICDGQSRSAWLAEHYFGVDDNAELRSEHATDERRFRETLANHVGELVAWVSRRCAREYCDFLEFLSAAGRPQKLRIVDLSEARTKHGMLYLSVGACGPDVLGAHIDSAKQLGDQERERYLSQWKRLSEENGDLRMLEVGNLASTTLEHFDGEILKLTPPEWTKAARIVGNAMGWVDFSETQMQAYCDLFWFNRLRRLAECGAIEWMGPPNGNMREVSVRRLQ